MAEPALVGRDRQLGDLDDRLAAARAGVGGVVLVEGDAGTGKTALAHEAAGRARAAGMPTAWGGCLEGDGAAPYRPWTQITAALGPADEALSDAGSRPRLYAAVVDRLRAASAGRGLLVVVDDAHTADVPSLRLLRAVAEAVADAAVVLVVLFRGRDARERPGWSETERAVLRERGAARLTLGGLPPEAVGELAGRLLGRRPDDGLLRAVTARAEGNPLFVVELLRLVEADGRAAADRGLPATVREVIGRRLDRLPAPTRVALRDAAVLGRDLRPGALAALRGEPADTVTDLVAPAVDAGLLGPAGHGLRFDHVLTRDVLYAELPAGDRMRLHARAAAVVRPGGDVDLLAYHLREAAPLGNAPEAYDAALEAARRATAGFAHEHAAVHYGHALDLLAMLPDGSARRPGLLVELARSRFRSGDLDEAWRACAEAAGLARAAGDAATVADAATVVRGITNAPVTAQVHALSRQALDLLGDADPVRRARLLAQLAVTADPFAADVETGLAEQALAVADESGDPETLFLALQAFQAERIGPQHVWARLEAGTRAVALGRDTGVDDYAAWGRLWRLDVLWELGRRVELDAELAVTARLVEHLREPLWRWRLIMVRAQLALHDGRFDDARALGGQALEVGRRGGHEAAGFLDLVFRDKLAQFTGEGVDLVEPAVLRFVADGPYLARGWLAQMYAALGRLDEARAVWETVKPHLDAWPRRAPEGLIFVVGNAEVCARLDDASSAPQLYRDLLPYADRQVIVGAHTPSQGPMALYLGMLATVLGDGPAAREHLAAALASARAMGSAPYEAVAHLETARMLHRLGQPRDHAAALRHADAALEVAGRLGMAPVRADAARARAAMAAVPVLSAREEQVAGLVAQGLSNRQIATRLHLSERTVENHVAHAMTKLGFDSRARLAAWHATRGAH